MTERWVTRLYTAFVAVAVCSELFMLAALLGANVPEEGWWGFVGAVVAMGFLNFLSVFWVIASWKFRWMVGLETGFQIAVVLAVTALVIWGATRSWRTKLTIMALLIVPGVAFATAQSWLRLF